MSAIVPFSFDGENVRVIVKGGEPWFALTDVCRVLDIANSRDAASRLDDDEKDDVGITDAIGRQQQSTIISEPGLYSLVLTSRKPEAKRFKKWVTADVIPSIRKTGSYGAPDVMQALGDPATLRGLLGTYAERVIALEGKVQEQAPKVAALERIAEASGSMCITDAAKTLQVLPHKLFAYLRQNQWIYKRPGTHSEVAYQIMIQRGWLEHKVTVTHLADGSERVYTQVRVTPKGLAKLGEVFGVTPDLFA